MDGRLPGEKSLAEGVRSGLVGIALDAIELIVPNAVLVAALAVVPRVPIIDAVLSSLSGDLIDELSVLLDLSGDLNDGLSVLVDEQIVRR